MPKEAVVLQISATGLGGVRVFTRRAQSQRVDIGNTNVGAVEAVGLIDLGDARVTRLGEDNVDALKGQGQQA